ncbi:MAG: hypothetical protein HYR66_07590 [Sphingobacteriales bacterium]|nr:hypothetical protein [Sphingobacteriales bacterium]
MRKYLLPFLFVFAFAIQDCKTTNPVETKSFPVKNIPEHLFKINITKLRDSISSLFDFQNQDDNKYLKDIFYFYPSAEKEKEGYRMPISFQAETKQTALFGRSYFEKPNTSNDIYIHDFGICWLSKLYYSNKKPLEYRTAFVIRLTETDKELTKVSIVAEAPVVINGISGYGPHGAIALETAVESSTIEDYSILLFIADK